MRRLALTNLCVLLLATPAAWGQAPATPKPATQPDTLEGRPIRELRLIQLDASGKPGKLDATLEQLIRNQARSLPGTAFARAVANEDLTRLNRLGHFKSLESQAQQMDDGSVVVTFTFTEQPLVQDVQVVGNRELADQEILKNIVLLAGTPIDRFQIDRNARAIEDLYRSKGYYRCRVAVDEKELADSGIVLYRIIEGDRVRVGSVRFEGNTAFTPKELRSSITTTEFFPVIEKGPLDDDVLSADVASLMKFYRDRGYLDARTSWRIQPSPDGKEAVVTFHVDEGPLYNLRSVRVMYTTRSAVEQYRREVLKDERADIAYLSADQMLAIGRRPLTSAQVGGLMTIKPGDVYSEDKLRKSQDAIRAAYGKLGMYLDKGRGAESVSIVVQEIRDEKLPQVDLLLFIEEGTPARVGEVSVIGNDLTRQQVVLRQMQLKPERPLDSELLDQSKKDIEATRLFEPGSVKITVQPEDPERPGVHDVNIEVHETNTGQFNFGVAVGSDAGVVGQIGMVQKNFDVLSPPHTFEELFSGQAFRGAGQTFDVEILPGTVSQTYSATLVEPYLFESEYSGSATVFFSTRDYREFDERRYGARVGVGRRFGTLWKGNIVARAESIDLSNIEPDRPVDVFEVEDQHSLTGVGVEFTRDTTNDRFRPWRGNHVSLGVEQVGAMGGDFDFTHFRYQSAAFFAVSETFLGYHTVLKLTNNIDYIPQDKDSVPTYERVYLGGNSFRGFGFRTVSPKGIRHDTLTQGNDPVGGTFSFFLGAELNQPLYKDVVSIVTFLDTGTVENEVSFDHYRVSAGIGFRLSLPGVSPVPLAFDFGFPLVKQEGDRRRLFSFSIDLPYQ